MVGSSGSRQSSRIIQHPLCRRAVFDILSHPPSVARIHHLVGALWGLG